MKAKLWGILKCWLQGSAELLFFFPVLLFIGIAFFPSPLLWPWIFSLPVFYLIGACVCMIPLNKRRLPCMLMGILITVGIAYLMYGFSIRSVIHGCIGFYLFYRGVRFMEVPWQQLFSPVQFWIGLFTYIAAYLAFKIFPLPGAESFAQLLLYPGIASIGIYLFMINFLKLRFANLRRKGSLDIPPAVSRHNRITTIVTFLVILAVAGNQKIKEGAEWLGFWISSLVAKVLSLVAYLLSLLLYVKKGKPQAPPVLPPPAEEAGRGFLYYLAAGLSILIFLIALAAFLYLCWRGICNLIRRLSQVSFKFRQRKAEDEGYVDEKENLMNWSLYAQQFRKRLSKLFEKEPRWEDLRSNGERIRYLYRHLLLRCMAAGYVFKDSLTPSETVSDLIRWDSRRRQPPHALVDLYNQARYGNKEISDKDVEKIRQEVPER